MPLPVTAVYAALLTLWILYLAARTGMARRAQGVWLGDGGNERVLHESRAHGNAVETVPLTLVLMALAEGVGTPPIALHPLGLALLAARVLHGLYFFTGAKSVALRAAGAGGTMLVQLALAAGLLGHVLAGTASAAVALGVQIPAWSIA
ncbi:MAG: MAPEG family protein [Pikeienuella sp.]